MGLSATPRMVDSDWAKRWPNFTRAEMACKHTGRCEMSPDFMDRLQALRTALGFPFSITSAYRDPSHPVEARKGGGGAHTYGRAVDISARGLRAYQIVTAAGGFGLTGIGVHRDFIHLDDVPDKLAHFSRPMLWLY